MEHYDDPVQRHMNVWDTGYGDQHRPGLLNTALDAFCPIVDGGFKASECVLWESC